MWNEGILKIIQHPDGRIEFDVDMSPAEALRLFASAKTPAASGAPTPAKVAPAKVEPTPLTGKRIAGEQIAGSLPAKIVSLIKSEPARSFRANEIAEAIGSDARAVSAAIGRVARQPLSGIENVGRGLYRASGKSAA